jgi:hypothetical protein
VTQLIQGYSLNCTTRRSLQGSLFCDQAPSQSLLFQFAQFHEPLEAGIHLPGYRVTGVN